jgi:pSer/pThr/pTyr-binding forkhead associated (FHA) protein
MGRSTDCDVVLTNRNVSRRHAEIIESPKGYLIVDSSTNGSFVNGERVQGQRRLDRGDVIRVGDDEFRFYAEAMEEPKAAEPEPEAQWEPEPEPQLEPESELQPEPEPELQLEPEPELQPDPFLPDPAKARGEGIEAGRGPPPPPPPPGAKEQLRDTLFGVPGVKIPGITRGAPPEVEAPRPPPPPPPPVPEPEPSPAPAAEVKPVPETRPSVQPGVLANLMIRSGDRKGDRFAIKVPIANIGRAEYNDVVIADPSVSTSHAKLQRREGIWVLVDLDSTNGTRVDGEPVRGEAPLAPGAKIRFGNVDVLFEPTDDAVGMQPVGGTQFIDRLPVREQAPEPKPEPEPATVNGSLPEGGPPTPPAIEEPVPEWSVVAAPSEPQDEPAPSDSQLFTRVIWGLLVLVVLAVLIIVFAG